MQYSAGPHAYKLLTGRGRSLECSCVVAALCYKVELPVLGPPHRGPSRFGHKDCEVPARGRQRIDQASLALQGEEEVKEPRRKQDHERK